MKSLIECANRYMNENISTVIDDITPEVLKGSKWLSWDGTSGGWNYTVIGGTYLVVDNEETNEYDIHKIKRFDEYSKGETGEVDKYESQGELTPTQTGEVVSIKPIKSISK